VQVLHKFFTVFLIPNFLVFFFEGSMASSFEAVGTLHEIFSEVQVTEKFRKREFVLEMANGMYTDYVKFQLVQDKCSALNSFSTGESVKVYFNLSGRKGTTRDGNTAYYTNLSAWKLERADGTASAGSGAASGSRSASGSSGQDAPPPDDDDVPF
jgi:single-strand DNA-binding protein